MKLKKNILFSIFYLIVVFSLLAGCSSSKTSNSESSNGKGGNEKGSGSSKEVVTLNLNNVASPTSTIVTDTLEPWKKLVEEKSDGRIKVNLNHSASLGAPTSVLQDVEGGLYEIGLLLPHYFYDSSVYPITITNLPFALSHVNLTDTNEIMQEFSEKYYQDTWKNVVPLTIFTAPDSVMVSKVPIKSIDDFDKLKTRTQGSHDSHLAKTWGGSPVALPLTEIYSGLQTGLIDLTINTAVSDASDLKLYEVADYAVKFKFNRVPMSFIMNKAALDSMPADLKELFEKELIPAFQELSTKTQDKRQEESYKKLGENYKEVIEIPEAEYKKLSGAGEKLWTDWVKDANSRGYDGEKMMKDFKEMIKSRGYSIPFEK
jgi:TRAP-type transport system periplasmic protein